MIGLLLATMQIRGQNQKDSQAILKRNQSEQYPNNEDPREAHSGLVARSEARLRPGSASVSHTRLSSQRSLSSLRTRDNDDNDNQTGGRRHRREKQTKQEPKQPSTSSKSNTTTEASTSEAK